MTNPSNSPSNFLAENANCDTLAAMPCAELFAFSDNNYLQRLPVGSFASGTLVFVRCPLVDECFPLMSFSALPPNLFV